MLAPYLDFQISVSIETLVKGVTKPDAIVCVSFHSHTCRPNQVQTTLLDCLGTTKGQKVDNTCMYIVVVMAKLFLNKSQ
jgi:hypothetical protein